jgi:hypothetical protein
VLNYIFIIIYIFNIKNIKEIYVLNKNILSKIFLNFDNFFGGSPRGAIIE